MSHSPEGCIIITIIKQGDLQGIDIRLAREPRFRPHCSQDGTMAIGFFLFIFIYYYIDIMGV